MDNGCNCAMREMRSIEQECDDLRKSIKFIEGNLVAVLKHPEFELGDNSLDGPNIPETRNANIKANLTLAFRHLEDARMRLGKAMQAYQGGISILDKK